MSHLHSFERFGSYILLERIACGGMAAIYLARPADEAANGRLLIIKRILPQAAADPEFQRMFQTEIQICMGFNHPNITHLHDFGRVDGQPYIAMEYVEGRNLRQIVAKFSERAQIVPIAVAASIAAQAAAALHYAHTFLNRVTGEPLHIIHRDVSPQNILVSYDGNVKLIDFGIAKAEIDAVDQTRTGSIKGKVCYLSPEQARREELNPRTDVFSLGAVLWEMLTGQKLFTLLGRGDLEVMRMITDCEQHVKAPSKINPRIPAELDEIVMKALQKNQADRFASAAEMQSSLRKYLLRHHPGFGYADVAKSMQEMFAQDSEKDRVKIREMNGKAQSLLSAQADAQSRTTIVAPPELSAGSATWPGVAIPAVGYAGSYTPAGQVQQSVYQLTQPIQMQGQTISVPPPSRISSPLRTKLLFGLLYVSTLLFVQVDREYMFFDRFLIPTEVVRMASTEAAEAKGASAHTIRHSMMDTADKKPSHPRGVTRRTPASANQAAPVALQARPAVGLIARLQLAIEPMPRSPSSLRVLVNGKSVRLSGNTVEVPLRRAVTLRVEQRAFAPFETQFRLEPVANGENTFRMPVRMTRKAKR